MKKINRVWVHNCPNASLALSPSDSKPTRAPREGQDPSIVGNNGELKKFSTFFTPSCYTALRPKCLRVLDENRPLESQHH